MKIFPVDFPDTGKSGQRAVCTGLPPPPFSLLSWLVDSETADYLANLILLEGKGKRRKCPADKNPSTIYAFQR